MPKAITKDGWIHQRGDQYIVTGQDANGKKFRKVCAEWQEAQQIEVFKGSKWLLRDEKRHLIKRFD